MVPQGTHGAHSELISCGPAWSQPCGQQHQVAGSAAFPPAGESLLGWAGPGPGPPTHQARAPGSSPALSVGCGSGLLQPGTLIHQGNKRVAHGEWAWGGETRKPRLWRKESLLWATAAPGTLPSQPQHRRAGRRGFRGLRRGQGERQGVREMQGWPGGVAGWVVSTVGGAGIWRWPRDPGSCQLWGGEVFPEDPGPNTCTPGAQSPRRSLGS